MPDGELAGVEGLSKNALKRRCRQQKSGTKKFKGKDGVPVSQEKGDCVPVSPRGPETKSSGEDSGWYDRYKLQDFVALDVEKVCELRFYLFGHFERFMILISTG